MKTYQIVVHYEDGKIIEFSRYKNLKVPNQQVIDFSKNRRAKKVILVTEDNGKESQEVVWEKNQYAQALGKLSAQSRDTSSEAMRELVKKRWNK